MKRILFFLALVSLLTVSTTTMTSCSRKSGCPSYDSANVQTDKDGNFKKTKRGKSNLFPKKMRRN
jgi:hypothetical protein